VIFKIGSAIAYPVSHPLNVFITISYCLYHVFGEYRLLLLSNPAHRQTDTVKT